MISGRNEWIAIGVLIVYIAFIPCPGFMTEFFSSSVGKMVALGIVVYAIKYVSVPVALLMFIALDRKGAIREYLDESGLTTPSVPTATNAPNEFTCPDGFTYVNEKMMCMKGNESKTPQCADVSMTWDSMVGKCISKAGANQEPSGGGPEGGSTPGAMAAKNELANSAGPTSPKELFTPYTGKGKQEFAPL